MHVVEQDLFARNSQTCQEARAPQADRAGPADDRAHPGDLLAGEVEGIEQGRGGHDRRAVEILVKDRDGQRGPRAVVDLQTLGRPDVLEVDSAEGRLEHAHGVDDRPRVIRVQLEIEDVDVRQPLEEQRHPFLDRLGGQGPHVSQARHGGTVGHNRDEVAARRVAPGRPGIAGDDAGRKNRAGQVGQANLPRAEAGFAGLYADLPRPAAGMVLQRLFAPDHQLFLRRSAACLSRSPQ